MRRARRVRNIITGVILALGGGVRAQVPPPQPIPYTIPPATLGSPLPNQPLTPYTSVPPTPIAPLPPSPLTPAPRYDTPIPAFQPDRYLEDPGAPWVLRAAVELGLLVPHVRNRLNGSTSVSELGVMPVRVPGVELDATVAPRIELSIPWSERQGSLLFAYSFMASEGQLKDVTLFSGEQGSYKSRVDLNVFDLDYQSAESSPFPHWDATWRAGVRLQNLFYDSRFLGDWSSSRVSQRFLGFGSHAGFDLTRLLPLPGLAFLVRGDSGLTIGEGRQGFEQIFNFADGSALGGADSVRRAQAVPSVNFQLGLQWTPAGWGRTHFRVGYQYQGFWFLGGSDSSRTDLSTHGGFLRAEIQF